MNSQGSLNLSGEEISILTELLESERAKLLVEIRHTVHRAFRDELRQRLSHVESLAERCRSPQSVVVTRS